MDFKRLRTFCVAATHLNFSKASLELACVQSAVTAQIKTLEDELGVKLFKRHGRGVSLTPMGSKLKEYAEQLFALRAEATQVIQGLDQNDTPLRIAGYETVLTYRLPKVIHQFRQAFPHRILEIKPLQVKNLTHQVLHGDIDLVFILGNQPQNSGLNIRLFLREAVVLIAHPDHPLAQKPKVDADDLRGETLLLTEHGCVYRNKFERTLIQAGALTGDCLEFVSIEAIKACVRLNTGIAAMSEISVTQELAQGQLATLPWCGEDLSVTLLAVWPKNSAKQAQIESFLEFLAKEMPF